MISQRQHPSISASVDWSTALVYSGAFVGCLALALLLSHNPWALILLVGFSLVVGIAFLDPFVPLAVALLIAPLDLNYVLGSELIPDINLTSALAAILVSGAMLRCALLGQLRLQPLMVIGAAVVVAIFVASAPEPIVEPRQGMAFFAQLLLPIAGYLVARNARSNWSDSKIELIGSRVIVGSLILAAVLTIITIYLGHSVETIGGEGAARFAGSLGSGSFAFFLLAPLILVGAALSIYPTRGRWLLFFLLTSALMATLTRSALIAAAAGVLYFGLFSQSRSRSMLVILVCVALGGLFVAASPDSLNRFRPSGEVGSNVVTGTLKGRENLWEFIWKTRIEPSPIVGSGIGATEAIFDQQTTFRTGAGAVHNDYLNVWAQTGLLGLAAYAAFLVALLFGSARAAIREQQISGENSWLVIVRRATPALIAAFIIVSFFDNAAANFVHMGLPVFIVVGVAFRSSVQNLENNGDDQSRSGRSAYQERTA